MNRRKLVLLLVSGVLAGTLSACGGDDPKPLTVEQAERLATVRFTLYTRGVVPFTAKIPDQPTATDLSGRMDFRAAQGIAAMSAGEEHSLLQWTTKALGSLRPWTEPSAPEKTPTGLWTTRPLLRQGKNLDTALLLLGELGKDRPENAQLLQASSARWLRSDTVDSTDVDVFTAPSEDGSAPRTRYWVDGDGALVRFEVRLGSAEDFSTIDLAKGGGPAVARIPQLDGR